MVERRTVEDRLRSEYAALLPAMQRTRTEVETEVQHLVLRATLGLDQYERIIVRARLKDCESAVDALRRREKFGFFDADHLEQYSLTSLPDLVVFGFSPSRNAAWKRLTKHSSPELPVGSPTISSRSFSSTRDDGIQEISSGRKSRSCLF